MPSKPRILVAPLDWGLGHAARCVPIIWELQRQGAEPVIGAAGRAAAYLRAEFPELLSVPLPAYGVRYPTRNMYWNISWQAPALARAVWAEHRLLRRLVPELGLQAVISDNRFGCYAPQIPCVFVSHQLNLPIGAGPMRWLADRVNRWFIRRYAECWIPDGAGGQSLADPTAHCPLPTAYTGGQSLAGRLAAPFPGLAYRRLGLLSRLTAQESPPAYDVLALLSGPEPQRSYLEAAIIAQARSSPLRVLLAQGKTESLQRTQPAPNIAAVSFLDGSALQQAMAASRLVLCRSGYSSLMDLAVMGKKALLIPTPGQAEQEYLARRLQQQGICPCQPQRAMRLADGLAQAAAWPGFAPPAARGEGLADAVRALLSWL